MQRWSQSKFLWTLCYQRITATGSHSSEPTTFSFCRANLQAVASRTLLCGYAIYFWTGPEKLWGESRDHDISGWKVGTYRPPCFVKCRHRCNIIRVNQGCTRLHISRWCQARSVLCWKMKTTCINSNWRTKCFTMPGLASLSRRRAVLKDRTTPEGRYISQEESAWRPTSGHFSASLGLMRPTLWQLKGSWRKRKPYPQS